jgi:hypothetical protein
MLALDGDVEAVEMLAGGGRASSGPARRAAAKMLICGAAGNTFQQDGMTPVRVPGGRWHKTKMLPDFFIGAHAAVLDIQILTRDVRRYRSYFPDMCLIAPNLN